MDDPFDNLHDINDNSILAVAQAGRDTICYVTSPPSALLDGRIEAIRTFDPHVVVVVIDETLLSQDFDDPAQIQQFIGQVLAEGTRLAEQLFDRNN